MKDYTRIARKITIVLFLSQSLSSAGFIAAFTVNALVGVDLSGQTGHGGCARRRLRAGAGLRRPGLGLQHGADRPARGSRPGPGHRGDRIGDRHERGGRPFLAALPDGSRPGGNGQIGRRPGSLCRGGGPPAGGAGRAISNVVLGSTVGAVFGPLLVGPTGTVGAVGRVFQSWPGPMASALPA